MKQLRIFIAIALVALVLCACQKDTANDPDPTTATGITSLPEYIEVMREGELSQIPIKHISGTVGNYIIGMDDSYFTFIPEDTGTDLFWYEAWGEENPIYYTISAYPGSYDPNRFFEEVKTAHAARYSSCAMEQTTVNGLPATVVRLESCLAAADFNRHLFLIDCGEARYVIETEFVTEMYEGLYTIILASINTFIPVS